MNRIVVLTSGTDSALEALIDNAASGDLSVEIAAVISNSDDAPGLTTVTDAGIEVHCLSVKEVVADGGDRDGFDVEFAGLVAAFSPDLIVVTGRTVQLGEPFLERFPGIVIKAHPAMPGAFPGSDAIASAYDAFAKGEIKRTGVTVHRVLPEATEGTVVVMEPVPIFAGEPLADLEGRVNLVEDNLIVAAVHLLLGEA